MSTFNIQTPNQHFSGIREGVEFINGKAQITDQRLAQRFVSHFGYLCPELNHKPDEPEQEPVEPAAAPRKGKRK